MKSFLSDAPALLAKIVELEAKVAYLSDRQQIHDVYLRYMRGVDRNDMELLKHVFWPDVQMNHGAESSSFDEFVDRYLPLHAKGFAHYAHLITNGSVDITGDVAHAENYVTGLYSKKDGKSMIVAGRFIDRLDRRNGEWRIAVREFVPHFATETNTALDSYLEEGGWIRPVDGMGTWDKRDLSYRRPLNRRPNEDVGSPSTE